MTELLFRSATVVLVVWLGITLPIKYSGGDVSVAVKYVINWSTSLSLDRVLLLTLAGVSVLWASWERRKRLQERADKDRRIKELEQVIDPKRSSSGLSVDGTHLKGGDGNG